MDHTIPVVAYYIDGPHEWTASEIGLFTTNVHVKIASRFTTPAGNVIDCESGDTTPAEAAQWAAWRRADGYLNPMVYVSVDNQQAVIQAFLAAGQALPEWWLAHWDDVLAYCEAPRHAGGGGAVLLLLRGTDRQR